MKVELVKDNSTLYDYVENSFCLPFYELIYEEWLDNTAKMVDEQLFYSLINRLEITVDTSIIEKRRTETGKIIDTFHSISDVGTFLYIDHFKDPTDQNDMIKVALRYKKDRVKEIQPLFFEIYTKNGPRCNFEIDYWNQKKYNLVFNSAYFIKNVSAYLNYKIYFHQ